MTRTLVFKPTEDIPLSEPSIEQKRFALLVNMFFSGGNLLHFNPQTGQTTRNKEDRRGEAKFVRAYKTISEEQVDKDGKPNGERKLRGDGGALVLDQPTFVLLEKYIAAAPGLTQDADVIEDLLDWVSAADKKGE